MLSNAGDDRHRDASMPQSPGSSLRVTSVTKTFGGTTALDNVSLEVGAGRVHALLGSNGSGKSTLVKILAGVHQATSGGDVRVDDEAVASTSISAADSKRLGLRFVHQQLGLFPQLSIAENFAATAGFGANLLSTIDRRSLNARTARLLEQFGIGADPTDRVDQLRPSVQTLVAIGRTMADRETARILILDEPTESLPSDETERLLAAIKDLAVLGITFIIVTHRLADVAEVADEVTVLRDGVVVASAPIGELSRDDLVKHIAGRRLAAPPAVEAPIRPEQPLLAVDTIAVGSVRELSFNVFGGEIVGIAGLAGSGRSAVLEGIFAARPLTSGHISLSGRRRHFRHPGDAVGAGIGLVPEDRAEQALFPERSVSQNLSAATVRSFFSRGSMNSASEREHAAEQIRNLGIKAASPTAAISTLSGGNQQKTVLARWLDTSPVLLLLDEPTQGVDVGARSEIHAIIRKAAAGGMAVLLVSSDLDELCELSSRVLVLARGRLSHEVSAPLSVGHVAELMHRTA